MSNKEKKASRKMVKKERIAICPYFGCSHLKKIKPLKFGIFGFHKYPKCPKHKISLVYTDDFIGNFLHAVNACLFDVKSFLSENLMNMIKTRHQEERNAFFHGWMYCTSIGRGAQVVSNYMDGLSRAYMKVLSKKQRKALEDENYHTNSNEMICLGFNKIVTEYATFVKEFREKSALFYDSRELTPISDELQKILEMWLLNILNNIQLQSMKIKDELTPREGNILLVKEYYDSLLHAGTCA